MILATLLLLSGLTISGVAIYYSVMGLIAIFSAAAFPIMVMGVSLEIGKLVIASWVKSYWDKIPKLMRAYGIIAVAILMLITSLGIFGFLSKAHSDQSLVSGDVQAKLAIYDEKIKVAKENVENDHKILKQMDESVDQTMGRSNDEKGADKAVALRKSQAKERSRLMADIASEQKVIEQLNEDRAPIAAENRKVEAEVGPIKYIAKFIYGEDGASENMLEKAVTWVIILIVLVFDPLAVVMLLASQMTYQWVKGTKEEPESESEDEEASTVVVAPDVQPQPEPIPEPEPIVAVPEAVEIVVDLTKEHKEPYYDDIPMFDEVEVPPDNIVDDINQLLTKPPEYIILDEDDGEEYYPQVPTANVEPIIETVPEPIQEPEPEIFFPASTWINTMDERPGDYIEPPQADNKPELPENNNRSDFGNEFPPTPKKGDTYLRTDFLPNRLFKYNDFKWIQVDKDTTDVYAYEEEYIKYLITEIDAGRYDPDSLTDIEREQIAQYLGKNAH